MKKLVYCIQKDNSYENFYEYVIPKIDENEIYARQLCTYFIKNNRQYELISNEVENENEILILKELGDNKRESDEINYGAKPGIPIEFRKINSFDEHTFLTSITRNSHWEAIRYLLKDYVEVPGNGIMRVSSTEIDEDRGCYVMYVKEA